MIKGGKEVDISKLSSDVFSVNNLNVDGKSILLGRVGVGSGGAPINNALTVVGLDKYTSDGNRLSTHFGYGQFRIYYGSNNSVDDESNVKYNNRAHLDIGYNIGKIGSLSGHLSELGGAYLQTQIDFVGHTPICINPMGGNVGVGTTNPVNKFHVVGETGLTVSSHKKSGERYSTLRLGLPYTNNHDAYCAKIESYNNHSQNYASDLRFHTHPGPKNYKYADERMRITSNGNVGIGTTSPFAALHIANEKSSDNEFTALRLSNRGADHATARSIFDFVVQDINSKTFLGQRKMSIRFIAGNGSDYDSTKSDLMVFDGNGNVGIGTKSPRGKLEVIGEGGMPIFIRSTAKNKNWNDGHQILSLRNDAITSKDGYGYGKPCLSMDWDIGNNAHWCFGQGGVTGVYGNTSTMGIGYQDKDENIAAAYGWVPKFFFTKGGNLGIGPSDPTSKLDVRLGQSTLTERESSAMNVYKNFNGVDNGNYAARIYALDHKIKETGIRICEKGGSNLKSSSTKVLDVYSNGSSVMTVGGDGKLTVKGGTGNVILGDNRVDLAGINDEHNGNDYAFIQRGNHGHPRFKNGSNKIPAGSSGDLFMINGDNYDNDIHIFATGGGKYHTDTGGTGAEGGRVILSNIINHSDNRIKHNEVTIPDALINIRKLKPKKYFKTNLPTLYPENHNFEMKNGKYVDNNGNQMSGIMECGLIAQEVEKIPFFESSVKKPKNEEDIYGLNYTNIFVTTLAALKELDILHTRTKQELANEKLKVSDLEKRLSALEKMLL